MTDVLSGPLPRDQLGPFLVLGVDKDAAAEVVEAHWAQRLIWARKNQVGVPLQDVNWARELLNDFLLRVRADVTSLNADTSRHTLRRLAERYGVAEPGGPSWEPLDVEEPPGEDKAAELPEADVVRRAIEVPELPWSAPALAEILDRLAREPLDPWNLPLGEDADE
jgi:hypothetical protein